MELKDFFQSPVRGTWNDFSHMANIATVNAYYNQATNTMVVPIGMLQPPLFWSRPKSLTFGAFGIVVGKTVNYRPNVHFPFVISIIQPTFFVLESNNTKAFFLVTSFSLCVPISQKSKGRSFQERQSQIFAFFYYNVVYSKIRQYAFRKAKLLFLLASFSFKGFFLTMSHFFYVPKQTLFQCISMSLTH